VVPGFGITASMFPEMSFVRCFPLFGCRPHDVIADQICIVENAISLKRKRYFRGRNAMHLYFERPCLPTKWTVQNSGVTDMTSVGGL